jgi:hypothetical protein
MGSSLRRQWHRDTTAEVKCIFSQAVNTILVSFSLRPAKSGAPTVDPAAALTKRRRAPRRAKSAWYMP